MSDEDGYVSLFDTRRKGPVNSNFEENTGLFSFFLFICFDLHVEINIEAAEFCGQLCEIFSFLTLRRREDLRLGFTSECCF